MPSNQTNVEFLGVRGPQGPQGPAGPEADIAAQIWNATYKATPSNLDLLGYVTAAGDLVNTTWGDVYTIVDGKISTALSGYSTTSQMNAAIKADNLRTINTTADTTYTFAAVDTLQYGGRPYRRFTSNVDVTVPSNANTPLAIGSQIDFFAKGTLNVIEDTGVVVNSYGGSLSFAGPNTAGTLVKVAADEWDLIANLVVV